MEYFYEEASLKLSIYAQAPLHPRRTLHQYRYGTLKMTEKLDKTQVVYRRTAPLTEYLHHPACKEQDRRKCQHAHCEEKTPRFRYCRQCFSDSQKLPRLIMVDQLWLWVLDESELSLYHKFLHRIVLTPPQERSSQASPEAGAATPILSTNASAHA